MRKILEPTVDRNNGVGRWSLRFIGPKRVSGAILMLALLHSPGPAFSVMPPGSRVTLAWDRSPDSSVTGYRVYYGGVSGNYTNSLAVGNATTATIPGLASGVTYFFAVSASATNGLESILSNEIAYTVPKALPTVRIGVTPEKQVVLTVSGLTVLHVRHSGIHESHRLDRPRHHDSRRERFDWLHGHEYSEFLEAFLSCTAKALSGRSRTFGWLVAAPNFQLGKNMNSMRQDLTKCRKTKSPGNTHQIVGLLKTVGVPNRMLYVRRQSENGSFWLRRIDHLQVLEQARRLYRKQIVCVHPDKAGGSLEQTIQLNVTWGKIERRFKQHGHELW